MICEKLSLSLLFILFFIFTHSSSSDSSDSNSSDSSTDSSDSEKELDEVSISQARNHMLTKLRTGLKKKYINS